VNIQIKRNIVIDGAVVMESEWVTSLYQDATGGVGVTSLIYDFFLNLVF